MNCPALVSCIMPTYSRRAYVPLAIQYFLRQDYAERELLIVDDGPDPVADLVPADPRIRYLRLPERITIGAKRNLACREATGQVIAHWDDDDWHAPHRLTFQVRRLCEAAADICGTRTPLFYDPRRQEAWQYIYPAEAKPWVCGNSMCYMREHWARLGFADISNGEDTQFAWSSTAERVLILPEEGFHVGILHDGNVSTRCGGSPRWATVPAARVLDMMGPDRTLYAMPAPAASSRTDSAPPHPQEPYRGFAVARESDLGLAEFVAYGHGQNLPRMRRWELPFTLFQSRLADTAAILDCTINPAGFGERVKQLYPFVQYHHAPVLRNGRMVRPSGFPDGSFDRVFCINTLEHLVRPQRETLIRDMARKLKPDGCLVLTSDYYFDSFWSDPAFLSAGVMRADRSEFIGGWNQVTPQEWLDVCGQNGLRPLADRAEFLTPAESDARIYRQAAPYPHAAMAAAFARGEPRFAPSRRVVLALLTWNTCAVTVDSLRAHIREAAMLNRLGMQAAICVCDNGSTDGTQQAIEAMRPEMRGIEHRFICNDANRGNSAARNQIIDYAAELGADYLLFVDGDIEAVPFSTFAMLRYMETHGGLLGSIGADSVWQTPDRQRAAPALFSIAGHPVETVNLVAWTQYGLFRREVFAEGVRFEEGGAFGGPGWGFEDNDLAFQMEVRGFINQRFSGMLYLHRAARSSVRNLQAQGLDPVRLYAQRQAYIVEKWANVAPIAAGPLDLVRRIRW